MGLVSVAFPGYPNIFCYIEMNVWNIKMVLDYTYRHLFSSFLIVKYTFFFIILRMSDKRNENKTI